MPGREEMSELPFPDKGIDTSQGHQEQPPGTTPTGQNVRLFENLTQRGRGGSRPGISKYIPDRVNGANYIQHLTSIVTCSGEAMGANFDGRDFSGDIGGFGLNFGIIGGLGQYTSVGGGFQPNAELPPTPTPNVFVAFLWVSHSSDAFDSIATATFTNGVSQSISVNRDEEPYEFLIVQGQTIWSEDSFLDVAQYADVIGGSAYAGVSDGAFMHNCETDSTGTGTETMSVTLLMTGLTGLVASVQGYFWIARVDKTTLNPSFVEWIVEGEGFMMTSPGPVGSMTETEDFQFTP